MNSPAPPPQPPRSTGGKVLSAARGVPLAKEVPDVVTQERLREGAVNTALNAVSILREFVEDFKNSDRFFKYKAGIVVVWLLMSAGSLTVAFSNPTAPTNVIGAKLNSVNDGVRTIYSVKNTGEDAWTTVTIEVNGTFRTTRAELAPNDSVTLSPKLLVDANGVPAPADLLIRRIRVYANDANATLLGD